MNVEQDYVDWGENTPEKVQKIQGCLERAISNQQESLRKDTPEHQRHEELVTWLATQLGEPILIEGKHLTSIRVENFLAAREAVGMDTAFPIYFNLDIPILTTYVDGVEIDTPVFATLSIWFGHSVQPERVII